MRKLLIFILQFLPFCGFAQNGFQRVFLQVPSAVDAETCTRSIKLANGNIASIGFNDGCAPCATTFYFRLSDPYGNEIRHTTYGAGVEWI